MQRGGIRPAESFPDDLKIEPQPTIRTAETNRSQMIGLSVDPLAIYAQPLGDRCRVNQTHRFGVFGPQQLSDAASNGLDFLGFDL